MYRFNKRISRKGCELRNMQRRKRKKGKDTDIHGVEGFGATEGDDGDAIREDAPLDEILRGVGHGGDAATRI